MRKFGAFIFALAGIGFALYAFPQTRELLPDFIKGASNSSSRIRLDNGIQYISLAAAAISWLLATVLNYKSIKLKNLEIEEKQHALREREALKKKKR